MDIYDYMMPAEARQLKRIAGELKRARGDQAGVRKRTRDNEESIEELRGDVNFLTMVLLAIIKRLSEKETMSVADVADILTEIDHLDGDADGGLDPGVLRGLLGIVRQATHPEESGDQPIKTFPKLDLRRYR